MVSKKTTRSKANTKSAPRRSSKKTFPCPSRDEPMSLTELIARMESDPAFATFILGLLSAPCTDEAAKGCLASYYSASNKELTDLGIHKSDREKMAFCTVVGNTNGTTGF